MDEATVNADDLRKLIALCREQRDWINEMEGWTPSSDDRNKYTDQLCCRLELQAGLVANGRQSNGGNGR